MSQLFGRSTELAQLQALLASASEGPARLAVVEGEAGIGKSALLAEVAEDAGRLGFRVFSSRADEIGQERPFRVLANALGCRRGDVSGRRRDIAELLAPADSSDADPNFYRLVDAFEDLVEAEALQAPTLLMLDDLQWADPATLKALAAITNHTATLPLAIVLAMRPAPRSRELSTLRRGVIKGATVLRLGPLGPDALRDFVADRLGAPPSPGLLAQLDRAGGNPFYVEELVEALSTDASIRIDDHEAHSAAAPLPTSLVLTVLYRLGAIPEKSLELLRTAAVLGGTFSSRDLRTAARLEEMEYERALGPLREHGLLTDDADRLRFRHDLIREAVYEDLGEPRRVAMHRRIGAALAEAGARAIEVADHFVRGAGTGDAEAAEWLVTASRDPTLDSASALALLERALEANPRHPRRLALLRQQARLKMWQGRAADAIPVLQAALSHEMSAPERLAMHISLFNASVSAGDERGARTWLIQAEAMSKQISERDSNQLQMAQVWFYTGDLERALALTKEFVDRIAGQGDAWETEAHNQASWLSTLLGRSRAALAHSERMLALPAAAGAKPLYWRHHAFALGDLDRVDEAEAAFAVARASAEELGLPNVLAGVLEESAYLRYSCGRWDDAIADAEAAASIYSELTTLSAEAGQSSPIPQWISYHRGEDAGDRGAPLGGRYISRTFAAVVALDRNESEVAGDLAGEVIAVMSDLTRRRDRREFDLLPRLASVCLATGRRSDAEAALTCAANLSERGDGAPGLELAEARCRVLVAGDKIAAERVVEMARRSPRLLWAAEALEDAAPLLESATAISVLGDALDLYRQMGSSRGHERVLTKLRALGAAPERDRVPQKQTIGWDALSESELGVVKLAADGLTNREIGAKLFISHRTVASHLSHAFAKLGLRSRVELAREAAGRLSSAD